MTNVSTVVYARVRGGTAWLRGWDGCMEFLGIDRLLLFLLLLLVVAVSQKL